MTAMPQWRTQEGTPLACEDKIQLLNENVQELNGLMQDALEEIVLMGGDENQLRQLLHQMIDTIPPWQERRKLSD